MIARIVLAVLIAASLALTAIELNRWRDEGYRATLSKMQQVRRVAGSLLLLLVLCMAYGGTEFPAHPAHRVDASLEVIYWLVCLLFAVFLFPLAYFEVKASLRRYVDERRRLRSDALEGMEGLIRKAIAEADKPTNQSNGNHPEAT